MNIILESARAYHITGMARIVEEDRELAWAEKHIYKDRDLKWILGNFVQADKSNSNGHIFPLEDLKVAQQTINNKPLNMLHRQNHIVGHYVAVEMLFPVEAGASDPNAINVPYIEALAAFYRYYFPEEYRAIEIAHSEGALAFSMECVPASLVCAADGCGLEFPYKGRAHESYCDHLREPAAPRRLRNPHFTAGALILPPVKPGWDKANVKELSEMLEAQIDPESIHREIRSATPHLDPKAWESMMAAIIEQARS
jgi:hypothetical protein